MPTSTPTPTATPTASATCEPGFEGDANGDGVIDAGDLTKVERIIAAVDTGSPCADANQDGTVNVTDIGVIEYMILGIWPWNHVYIEEPDSLPYCTNFTVAVFVTYVGDFGFAGYQIRYNASILDFIDVENGSLVETATGVPVSFYDVNVTYQTPVDGYISLNNSIDGNPGVDGAGYLARLRFHVNGSAGQTSGISFNPWLPPYPWLKDTNSDYIAATWANTSFTVAP